MVTTLELLLKFLRICRFAGCICWRTLNRWPVLLAFLSRRLSDWRRMWHRKPSTSQTSKPAEPSMSGTMAGPYSASVKGYVSTSFVPASASDSTFRRDGGDRFESRSVAAAVAAPSTSGPTRHSVDHPQAHTPYTTHFLHGGDTAEGSTSNLSVSSIQRRASDRLSIITANSRKSIRDPVGQPSSHFPKAVHRQFGRGPDASQSRERLSRPPSPASRPPTPHPSPRIVATDLPSSQVFHADGGRPSPIIQPSVTSSHTHEPLGPPPGHENRRKQPSIVVVDVQNPSTEELPIASSPTRTNPRQLTEEPLAMDTTLSPPASAVSELLPEWPPISHIPEGRIIQLIHSEQVPRYTKDNTMSNKKDLHSFSETDVPDPSSPGGQDCSPWIPATHPDGGLYFYDLERRIFTDTDMHNPTLKEEMEDFYSYLQKILRADQLTIPSGNYDLVLDIMPTTHETVQWSYYYACHETRCLFWLEKYDGKYMISELDGVESPAHIRHRLEDLYWNHWFLFPAVFNGRRLPRRVYDELMGILAHGCSSTLPYDDDTMQKMIALVRTAKKSRGGVEYYTAGTTRLLSFFAHWRFLHFHGQKHARLVRDLTVYDKPKRERTMLITLLSPLLFLAPEVHLHEVEKMWTDDVIIETVWKNFMTKLLGEWEDVILWSAVMLIANVGFLAIPGVVLSNLSGSTLTSASQVVIFTSPSQIASSISVEASIGGIVVGLLLLRHNRTKQKEDPAGASTYLFQNSHRIFGLEPMAIIFSLPWALLMWSYVVSVASHNFCSFHG
ncbi:hypothetical protein F5148DRAFT_1283882 [Russula earlei]|uniref:Uncharacterized protein n=1 Tax=Russula earlei TaxID=71964 RepID=A0ACC0UA36_9AGAM|nr:hypothetical protein F5148DRAFT_1283882 [Russula earlei]